MPVFSNGDRLWNRGEERETVIERCREFESRGNAKIIIMG